MPLRAMSTTPVVSSRSQIASTLASWAKVELFFKWIKQHLKIKSFYGQSANAVKTQIWIAISTYLLIATAEKKWYLPELNLHTLFHI